MPGMLAKKIGMTTIFAENGNAIPVSVLQAGPCIVYSVKSKDTDGYEAIQLGFGEKKEKSANKAQLEYYKKNGLKVPFLLQEFRNYETPNYKVGDEIKVEMFQVGEKVKVSGKSKGKGFQGVMKRHNFGGVGGTTHGQSDRLRAPGSIGSSSYPSRVFKGMKMAGRMGFENVTVRNLKVVKVDTDKNLILVQGAVPGAINSIVTINK
mgnify:FL=1|jgi:large subunit ribosomal protein L3